MLYERLNRKTYNVSSRKKANLKPDEFIRICLHCNAWWLPFFFCEIGIDGIKVYKYHLCTCY